MNMIEKHKLVRTKPNVYFHKFLGEYKQEEQKIYIICEGNEDLGYYGQLIRGMFPNIALKKMFVEGKNNVLEIHKYINWKVFSKSQILFFVDRDFSYWINEPQIIDSNIYITAQYSFENDIVCTSEFVNSLEDLYGFANATSEELENITRKYDEYWNRFVENSKFFMAALIVSYLHTNMHYAKNIEINKVIKVETDNIWVNCVKGMDVVEYVYEKLLIPIQNDVISEIDLLILRFEKEKEHYSVRGKWALAFFVKMMEYIIDNGEQFAPSLYVDGVKKPKRLCELHIEKAMSVLAPRICAPVSLVEFVSNNVKLYLATARK